MLLYRIGRQAMKKMKVTKLSIERLKDRSSSEAPRLCDKNHNTSHL